MEQLNAIQSLSINTTIANVVQSQKSTNRSIGNLEDQQEAKIKEETKTITLDQCVIFVVKLVIWHLCVIIE